MWDIILESVRSLIIAFILFGILHFGKQRGLNSLSGWNFILAGWLFILIGSLFDITDNFESLNRYIIIGDTATEAFIEKFLGFILGYVLLFIGFMLWLPSSSQKILNIKQDFISTVSHELRTPITSIYGALRLANAESNQAQLPDNLRQILDIALRNSERLTQLVNDILDLQRMDSETMVLNIQKHDAIDLCKNAIRNNTSHAANYRTSFEFHSPYATLPILVDAERFYQIMDNLLTNASKFSRPGSIVMISLDIHNKSARISVKDQGHGISDEFLPQLFTPFAQAHHINSRPQRGSGLGLAISQRLLQLMHGDIGYSTTLGKGSTFYFDLPLAREPS